VVALRSPEYKKVLLIMKILIIRVITNDHAILVMSANIYERVFVLIVFLYSSCQGISPLSRGY
jgi:hypothetical protein